MEAMHFEVSGADAGKRLDRYLAERMPAVSRARIQEWVRAGRVQVDQTPAKASLRLRGGEKLALEPLPREPLRAFPEPIPLDILYEDDDLAAINKPAGMSVHAGAGASAGTLVNALLHHFGALSGAGGELRPGIVHRLDRMTSGVLLVAKHDLAHQRLAAQFQSRQVRKTYWALVHGDIEKKPKEGRFVQAEGRRWLRLEMPLSRHPRRRVKMAARQGGRTAQTDVRLLERLGECSLVEVRIATGRTHQIRVHLSALGHPVVGDRLYGAPARPAGLPSLDRFFLHAKQIRFLHPATEREMEIEAPLAPEFVCLIEALKV